MRTKLYQDDEVVECSTTVYEESEGTKISDKKRRNKRRGFLHWYVYPCVDSTETRGQRTDKSRIPACGFTNVRKMKNPIGSESYNYPEQGAKCKNCGRRPRLNAGIMTENPINKYEYFTHNHGDEWLSGKAWRIDGVFHPSRSRTGPADVPARKQWALDEQARRNRAWARIYSPAIEEVAETIEEIGGGLND